jgi:colicin import membrane protein
VSTPERQREALMPRAPEGLRRPLVLAVVAHVALIIGLAFSVNWRSSDPPAMEAELWAAVPQTAARRSDPPPPADPPPPRPTPRAAEPPPKELPDAQIAIEKARKERLKDERERKAELEKKELEKKLLEKKELDKQVKRDQADKQAEKLLNDKKDLERKKKEEREKADTAAVANREAQLQRIMKQAGADNGSSGSAERSAGPSANYAGKVKAAVYPNITFVNEIEGNPAVEVEVRTAADGRIVSRRLIKSSGVAKWDEAVLDAIDKTAKLPRDGDKPPPSNMTLVFTPRER